jgi:hypothetical protein
MDKLKEATIPKTAVKKIADFMMDTFGTLKPEMNKENVELLSKKLGLANLKVNESFKENENIVMKALVRVSQVIIGNVWPGFTLPAILLYNKLAEIMGYEEGMSIPFILSLVLAYLFAKIVELFGYNVDLQNKHGYDGVDTTGDLITYNDHGDIRNPDSYHRKSLKNKADNFKTKIGFSK